MTDRRQVEEQLREAAEAVISNLPPVDVSDEIQKSARAALGELASRMIDQFETVVFASMPSPLERATLQYLNRSIELVADAHHLLRPSERTFARAHLVSHVLRALAEAHARTLMTWRSPDPDSALRGALSDSTRRELLALKAAELAGADVREPTRILTETKEMLGDHVRLNVVGVLEDHREHEVLSVYRWESGHIHGGTAELMARGRSTSIGGAVIDVGLNPASLWRVGQLTWAIYGLGLRSITLMARSVRLPIDPLVEVDSQMRAVVRETADRLAGANEPPSPPYGAFDFPMGTPGDDDG